MWVALVIWLRLLLTPVITSFLRTNGFLNSRNLRNLPTVHVDLRSVCQELCPSTQINGHGVKGDTGTQTPEVSTEFHQIACLTRVVLLGGRLRVHVLREHGERHLLRRLPVERRRHVDGAVVAVDPEQTLWEDSSEDSVIPARLGRYGVCMTRESHLS